MHVRDGLSVQVRGRSLNPLPLHLKGLNLNDSNRLSSGHVGGVTLSEDGLASRDPFLQLVYHFSRREGFSESSSFQSLASRLKGQADRTLLMEKFAQAWNHLNHHVH